MDHPGRILWRLSKNLYFSLSSSSYYVKHIALDGKTIIKALSGLECMKAQGWDIAHRQESPYKSCTDSQVRRLAGNAFNGHAFAAMIASVIAVQGLYVESHARFCKSSCCVFCCLYELWCILSMVSSPRESFYDAFLGMRCAVHHWSTTPCRKHV